MIRPTVVAQAVLLALVLAGCSARDIVADQQSPVDGGIDGRIVAIDAGTADAGPNCAMLPNCGCPAEETCGAGPSTLGCRPLGTALVDEECIDSADCAEGMRCVAYEERGGNDGPGVCARFCCSDGDCASGFCLQTGDTPDDVGVCASACDPVRGAGCPSPQVCRMFTVSGLQGGAVVANLCSDEGPSAAGQLCSWQEDCVRGLFCAYPSSRPPGEYSCRQVCAGDSDCAVAPCLAILDVAGEVLGLEAGFCASDCDLLTGVGCPGAMACRLGFSRRLDSSTAWFSDCRTEGARVRDQPCRVSSDCQSGHICANEVCRQMCALSDGTCDSSRTCAGFVQPIRVRGVEYGACVP